mgnify:CR=1 FL=1
MLKYAYRSVDEFKYLGLVINRANSCPTSMLEKRIYKAQAAFNAIKKAGELIEMSKHKGEHPRMGATDVCPLIPVSGITMEETAAWAVKLTKRVGEELNIPAYFLVGSF